MLTEKDKAELKQTPGFYYLVLKIANQIYLKIGETENIKRRIDNYHTNNEEIIAYAVCYTENKKQALLIQDSLKRELGIPILRNEYYSIEKLFLLHELFSNLAYSNEYYNIVDKIKNLNPKKYNLKIFKGDSGYHGIISNNKFFQGRLLLNSLPEESLNSKYSNKRLPTKKIKDLIPLFENGINLADSGHLGITINALKYELTEEENCFNLTLFLGRDDGICNGGHTEYTWKTFLSNNENKSILPNYVDLKVYTHLTNQEKENIKRASNTTEPFNKLTKYYGDGKFDNLIDFLKEPLKIKEDILISGYNKYFCWFEGWDKTEYLYGKDTSNEPHFIYSCLSIINANNEQGYSASFLEGLRSKSISSFDRNLNNSNLNYMNNNNIYHTDIPQFFNEIAYMYSIEDKNFISQSGLKESKIFLNKSQSIFKNLNIDSNTAGNKKLICKQNFEELTKKTYKYTFGQEKSLKIPRHTIFYILIYVFSKHFLDENFRIKNQEKFKQALIDTFAPFASSFENFCLNKTKNDTFTQEAIRQQLIYIENTLEEYIIQSENNLDNLSIEQLKRRIIEAENRKGITND